MTLRERLDSLLEAERRNNERLRQISDEMILELERMRALNNEAEQRRIFDGKED